MNVNTTSNSILEVNEQSIWKFIICSEPVFYFIIDLIQYGRHFQWLIEWFRSLLTTLLIADLITSDFSQRKFLTTANTEDVIAPELRPALRARHRKLESLFNIKHQSIWFSKTFLQLAVTTWGNSSITNLSKLSSETFSDLIERTI